tara:strand:+ start:476 stop:889 length:414 start_codon:yes stop_codon:yes gene_type:complete
MKKIIDQLLSLGHNALELKLQPIHWQDKEGGKQTTFAFSNRKASGKAIVNGKTEDAYSVSVFIPGQDQTTKAKAIVTVWCNDMKADEYEMYLAEYGAKWCGILDEENNCVVMSQDQAQEFLSSEQPTTDAPQASVNA